MQVPIQVLIAVQGSSGGDAILMVDRQLRITAANNELALFIEEQIRRQNLRDFLTNNHGY